MLNLMTLMKKPEFMFKPEDGHLCLPPPNAFFASLMLPPPQKKKKSSVATTRGLSTALTEKKYKYLE